MIVSSLRSSSSNTLVVMVEVNRKTKGADEARRMLERAIVPIARVPARELTKAQARGHRRSGGDGMPRRGHDATGIARVLVLCLRPRLG